jgi:hypothetical protein
MQGGNSTNPLHHNQLTVDGPVRTTLIASLAVTTLALLAGPANAHTSSKRDDSCPSGAVCLWSEEEYEGNKWIWRPDHGLISVPAGHMDHVGSFKAFTDACFYNTYQGSLVEWRKALNGDYRSRYLSPNFGGVMDAIGPLSGDHCPT